MKILVVEDEPTLNKIIAKRLKIEAYSVDCAFNGKEALDYLDAAEYDLLIVDIMMPEMDGLTLVKKLRDGGSRVPVLFLTALDSTQDKVTGLDSGGDDYLVKPYSLRELKARVDLLIRRRRQLAQASSDLVLTIGNLSIDRVAHKAFYREQDLCLANREYEVLLYLAEHPDRDITFEELGTALFGVYRESDRRSVMVNVSRLRKRFEGNYELENRIETVWSKGYRFLKGGI